ncbi:hypothetical protein BGW38_007129, partial [Lunasporangiospora selenospora]
GAAASAHLRKYSALLSNGIVAGAGAADGSVAAVADESFAETVTNETGADETEADDMISFLVSSGGLHRLLPRR